MKIEKIIKIFIVISIICVLCFWIGRQRFPENEDIYGIRGQWRYLDLIDEYENDLLLKISDSEKGQDYDFELYDEISGENYLKGYMIINSPNELTIYYEMYENNRLTKSLNIIGNVQRFSYKIKNRLFRGKELQIMYNNGDNNIKLMFRKEK